MKEKDITFKARTLKGEWVCGDLERRKATGRCFIHTYNADGTYNKQYEVDPDTVGISTGHKDCRGTDIFTGDIVKLGIMTTFVEFEPDLGFVYGGLTWGMLKPATIHELEIVGNIHDENNLLTAKA